MKFLIDAQLPPALAAWLRAKGHEAFPVREIGLREAEDTAIASYATAEGAIVVTKDQDFAFVAANSEGPRVLWVRTGNLVNRLLLARFEAAWLEIVDALNSGVHLVEMR